MATPTENAQTLHAYWQSAHRALSDNEIAMVALASGEPLRRLAAAMRAMIELTEQAAYNPLARGRFAAEGVFEGALLVEMTGYTDRLLRAAEGTSGARLLLEQADRKRRPPRQIMLDSIYAIGAGGVFFLPPDPSGATSWCKSVNVAGGALAGAIAGDPRPAVRASALRIVRDLALPADWIVRPAGAVPGADAQRGRIELAIMGLLDELPTSHLGVSERSVLTSLGRAALARIESLVAAEEAQHVLAELPAFPTGDGGQVATFPPRGRWWRDPRVLAGGAIGLVIGGAVAARR